MNLISTTDFILEQFDLLYKGKIFQDEYVTRTKKHADFKKQPLAIWMFVPCKLVDGVWVVLEYPKPEERDLTNENSFYLWNKDYLEYQQAEERCLFEGFESEHKNTVVNDDIQIIFYKSGIIELVEIFEGKMPGSKGKIETIEDLVKYKPELTATAQKQLGL